MMPPKPQDGMHALPPRYGLFLLALVATALVTRFQQFGNPIVHLDEQFYLLVGDRMLSGAIPYVDIWDRKPIGLFLIYAAVRALGGSGILQYQLVATGFAIGTAILVERLSARLAGPRGSTLAAILYLLWLPLLSGQGGQAPVFYNAFVAAAALALCRAAEGPRLPTRLFRIGAGAMLALGIALQVKYSAVFEGLFFGLALLWIGRRDGYRRPALLAMAAGWIVAALLPTIVATLAYWAIGHPGAFLYSNFVSIFQRHPLGRDDIWRNAAELLLYLAPLVILATRGAALRRRAGRDFRLLFPTVWLVVAIVSVVLFGYYFDHYGLPIVLPAAVSAATVLDRRRKADWPVLILASALVACLLVSSLTQRRRGTPAQFARLVDAVRPYAPRGMLVWDNLPALYYVLDAPLPTRYPFPTHLRDPNEMGAVGTDQPRELSRILAAHPAAIVIERDKPITIGEPTTEQLLATVKRDYHLVATIRVGRRDQFVYAWNGLPAGR